SEDVRLFTQQDYFESTQKAAHRRNQIWVDLLYAFRVTINGEAITKGFQQRHAKNIFIYLIFHPTTTREDLCENLWPHDSLSTAKKNLRVYLSYLKKLLNPYALAQPIIETEQGYVHLHGDVKSDLLTLLSDLRKAGELENDDEKCALAKRILDQLYSPNFLRVNYDAWFTGMRSRIELDLIHLASWLGQ